jgi:hypothetical protein
MPFRSSSYALTAPSLPVFVISLALAGLAVVIYYFGVRVPFLNAARVFDVLAIAYLLLLVGVVFRRL